MGLNMTQTVGAVSDVQNLRSRQMRRPAENSQKSVSVEAESPVVISLRLR